MCKCIILDLSNQLHARMFVRLQYHNRSVRVYYKFNDNTIIIAITVYAATYFKHTTRLSYIDHEFKVAGIIHIYPIVLSSRPFQCIIGLSLSYGCCLTVLEAEMRTIKCLYVARKKLLLFFHSSFNGCLHLTVFLTQIFFLTIHRFDSDLKHLYRLLKFHF